jgi:hypothetical protein
MFSFNNIIRQSRISILIGGRKGWEAIEDGKS